MSQAEATKQINTMRAFDSRNDISKYLYQEAINQQYAISLNGGVQNINYMFSAGYDKNKSSLVANGYDRLTLKNHTNFRPIPKLEIQTAINFSIAKTATNNPGPNALSATRSIYPYARLVNDNLQPIALEKDYRKTYTDTVGNGKLMDWSYNPIQELTFADNTNENSNLTLNLGLKYNILKQLKVEVLYQYQNQKTDGNNYYSTDTYYTRNLINRFTQLGTGTPRYIIPKNGIIDFSQGKIEAQNLRSQLNFQEQFSANHQFSAIFGAEIRSTKNQSQNGRYYGYDNKLLTSQAVDYVNLYPIFDNLGTNARIPYGVSAGATISRFISLYANAAYTAFNKYTATFSVRRDASNLFGVRANQKWNPLWSAGLGWEISKENFFSSATLPYLKLRATYGHSGNINPALSGQTVINYQTNTSIINQLPQATVRTPPNPELRWEKVSTTNLALDFQIKNQRIGGTLEYYIKRNTDLFAMVPADITSGFSSLTLNSAILKTKGIDLSISTENISGSIAWSSNILFSYNQNKIEKYLLAYSSTTTLVNSGNSLVPLVGYPAYAIFSYKWAGLDNIGDPQGYLNGELTKNYNNLLQQSAINDLVFHGSAIPIYVAALRNTVTWKNISLSANMTYRGGHFFRKPTVSYTGFINGGLIPHQEFYQRWLVPGDEQKTNVPAFRYPADSRRDQFYANSEANVLRADNIRLQDINITYTTKLGKWKNKPVSDLKFTLYANNLGLVWTANKQGLDPDFSILPSPLAISIGLTANF